MTGLSDRQLLYIWEVGKGHAPLMKALIILSIALPDEPWEALAQLSLGRRDARLFRIREATFGQAMPCVVKCPNCLNTLEFSLTREALAPDETEVPEVLPLRTRFKGYAIDYRLPNSEDMAALIRLNTPEEMETRLLQRCLLSVKKGRRRLESEEIPPSLRSELVEHICNADPLAKVELHLECRECGHRWTTPFDIIHYFWEEIAHYARGLLEQIHALARVYGWGEEEILRLSPHRRNTYLEMIYG